MHMLNIVKLVANFTDTDISRDEQYWPLSIADLSVHLYFLCVVWKYMYIYID